MSEPKFSVGQHVAVCSTYFKHIIPATVVTQADYHEGLYLNDETNQWGEMAAWTYRVADADPTLFFEEHELRPIRPDEYLDTAHQSTESREGVVL